MWLLVSSFFHLDWCYQDSSMLKHVSLLNSLLLKKYSVAWIYHIFCSFVNKYLGWFWMLFSRSVMSMMLSNYLIFCCPFLLLPSILPIIRVFCNDSAHCIKWLKFWSFSFSIRPSNEYSRLISFRNDWFDLVAVQETLKSLLQHHSPKASILQHLAFFMVQLSQPYVTTGKAISLNRWTCVGKVMSLLCNMLSRFVITFPPQSKCLLIS